MRSVRSRRSRLCARARTTGITIRQDEPLVDETVLPAGRSHPETNQCSHPSQSSDGDAIMLPLILNAIYSQFIQATLPGISSQGGKL